MVLDNAESILDPQGLDGQDLYGVVEELSQFTNICLVVTSRITTIPPDCKRLEVPTLSMEASRRAFHRIYDNYERPAVIDKILEQLGFHPLSITLLATVAHQNGWDNDRLGSEWEQRRTCALQTEHSKSLAATIELSLASPMFKSLGPEAREILGAVAFFPQGVNKHNLDWLFPTISDVTVILDKFRVLSLTHQSNEFITMLAPLQEYLRPKHPPSSPLLCAIKDLYFTRLSVIHDPDMPAFEKTRWIISEDANVEHLLDVFTSAEPNSDYIWKVCEGFLVHLYRHKPRRTVLAPKIEGLPDDHRFKPGCLLELADLLGSIGYGTEQKRLLNHTLTLSRDKGNDDQIAFVLNGLAEVNGTLGLFEEGISQAKEALEIFERICDAEGQGESLINLAWLLCWDGQLDAAEEAASRAIELLPETGKELRFCRSHCVLGTISRSKGERGPAIHHLKTALGIASPSGWTVQLFRIHYDLALLFRDGNRFDDTHAHIERAKSHAGDDVYSLGRAVRLQAEVYHHQHKLEDARSEALRALEIFERFGSVEDVESCQDLLHDIEESRSLPDELNSNGELLGTIP